MKCNNCKFEVSPSMTHAVDQNICPCCGKELVPAAKLAQIKELKRVLALNKITSEADLDIKIIDRVVSILCDYFKFEPLTTGEAIVIQPIVATAATTVQPPEKVAPVQPIAPQPAPTRDLDRERVFEETRAQIENEDAAEIMKEWYPPEVVASADLSEKAIQKLQAARGAVPKFMEEVDPRSRGKNSSIRRAE
jgi:hypothetical protein